MSDTLLVDPLGRRITLHDHTWFGHVLQGHGELRKHRALVHRVVTSPLEIRVSPADPSTTRLYFGVGPWPGMMILVAANVVAGFVKTAHLTKATKGALEWSRPTR